MARRRHRHSTAGDSLCGPRDALPRTIKVIEQYGIRSLCTLPLTTVHRRIGNFATGSVHPNAYSDEDVRLLWLVVDIIALAIEDELNVDASRRARLDVGRSH